MSFRAAPSRGGWIGLGFVAAGLLVLAGILSLMRSGGLGPRTAVLGVSAAALLPFLLLIAYWTWGFFSLRYEIGRDGLVLRWAASRQVIPMQEITRLMAGRAYATPLRGLHWPGHWVGRSQVEDVEGSLRETLAYATQPPEDQLLVMTHSLAYAISPADPEAFVADFKRRRSLGPAQQLVQHTVRPAWARLGIWSDPLALRALAVALTLSVLAFAWIAWQYPSLPERVVVQYRYDPALGATVQGPSQPLATVWLLPLIGLAALIVDLVLAAAVHARARLGANLLLIGASIMQILLLIVLTRLI
jgi:hypothetical protein